MDWIRGARCHPARRYGAVLDGSCVCEYSAYERIVTVPRAKHKQTLDGIVETIIYLYTESRRVTKERAREFGITGPQLTVVKMLEQLGSLSLSSLSEQLRAQNSTVTGIVDRMLREELVVRERSEDDRRIVLIRLSEKGTKLAQQIQIEPMEIFREGLDALPRKDAEELFRILDLVQTRVRRAIGASEQEREA
ncbi:MAG: MarR family transcriptional regulator [Myxococcales bacterium]|nr:MarR family transcriptional regulator [Myxococcales bacterium]